MARHAARPIKPVTFFERAAVADASDAPGKHQAEQLLLPGGVGRSSHLGALRWAADVSPDQPRLPPCVRRWVCGWAGARLKELNQGPKTCACTGHNPLPLEWFITRGSRLE
jgi:hypothetical protein